jgi:hypothetical protein
MIARNCRRRAAQSADCTGVAINVKALRSFYVYLGSAGSNKRYESAGAFNSIAVGTTAADSTWGTFIPGVAEPDPSAYGNRAARKGGRYNAFVPPNIADYPFTLTSATADDVEVGTRALKQLQELDLTPARTFSASTPSATSTEP